MLIENKGIKTNSFYLSPFELNKEEIVVLNILNRPEFSDTVLFLKDIFNGKTMDENVIIHQEMTFVEHFIEPKLRRLFNPITVGEFLKKNANSDSFYSTKIYENDYITKKTNVNRLAGTPRKLLFLYATLSKTNNIVIDVSGLDPNGVLEIYNIVKNVVKNGGSAIFLDSFEDMKNDYHKYIELQWTKD